MITNLCSEYTCRVLGLAMLFEEDTLKVYFISIIFVAYIKSFLSKYFKGDLPVFLTRKDSGVLGSTGV